jgi:MFS family permease
VPDSPLGSTAPAEARRTPARLLALLIAMTGVSSLSLNILTPAMPSLVTRFATDPATVQLTVSLYIMGLAAAQLVFGPLSDKFGRRLVVISGLALATVASTFAIFAGSIASLVIWRVVQSLGASTGQTIGRAIIRDLYERDRAASMIGLVTSVVVLMPMVAPLILLGWEAIFIFSAALSGCVLAWAVLALPETRTVVPAERNRFRSDFRALATNPRFFGYALCAGLGSGPFFSFLGGAPHVVVSMLGRTSCRRLASWQATSRYRVWPAASASMRTLYGSGIFQIDQLAAFTGFENITLNNFTSGVAELDLGSQPIAVTGYGSGSDRLYLGSGAITFHGGSGPNHIFSNSASNWNAGNVIDGSSQGYIFLNQNGSANATYDLTTNTLTHISYVFGNGANLTLKIDSTDTAGVSSFYGQGTNEQLVTSDTALDLSHSSVSGFTISSTNASGTTFTVQDVGTAFQIAGGPGQDTIAAQASPSRRINATPYLPRIPSKLSPMPAEPITTAALRPASTPQQQATNSILLSPH